MCSYIQSTSKEKDKAQSDTDPAVSFGHRAEFSTPKTGRQSEKNGIGHTAKSNKIPTGDQGPVVSLPVQVLDKVVNRFESLHSPGLDIFGSFSLTFLPSPGPEVSLAFVHKFLRHCYLPGFNSPSHLIRGCRSLTELRNRSSAVQSSHPRMSARAR